MARQRERRRYLRDYRHGMWRGRGIQWAGAYRGNGTAGEWGHNPLPWMDEDDCVIARKSLVIAVNKVVLKPYFGHGIRDGLSSFERTCAERSEIIRLVEESDPVAELALRRTSCGWQNRWHMS